MGMGCASRAGKLDQHSVVHPRVNPKQCRNCGVCMDSARRTPSSRPRDTSSSTRPKCVGCGECLVVCKPGAIKMKWDEDSRRLQEKMAEYALRVSHAFQGQGGLSSISSSRSPRTATAWPRTRRRIVDDIGILASLDPVAVDKATADLVIARGRGKDAFREPATTRLVRPARHGEKIGLGTMEYGLVELT